MALLIITGYSPMYSAEVEGRLLPIEKVDLYPSGVKVHRAIEISPDEEEERIRRVVIGGLPNDISRVQLQLDIEEDYDMGNLQFRTVEEFELAETPDVIRWKAELDRLKQRKATIENERADWDLRLGQQEALKQALLDGLGESPLPEMRAALTDIFESERKLRKEYQLLEAEWKTRLEALDSEFERAEKSLQRAQAHMRELSGELSFTLTLGYSGTVDLNLQYSLRDAGWQPVYHVNADLENSSVEFEYLAEIQNETGEPWENAILHLHTSQPSGRGDVPEIKPIYLRKPRGKSDDMEELSPFDVKALAPQETAGLSAFSRGATTFSVELPRPVNIPERTASNYVRIVREVVEAEFWSESAPLVAPEAFLQAKLVNPFEYPILTGSTQVFVEGLPTGEGQLDETLPGQSLTLGFGLNPNVGVKRKNLDVSAADTGLFEKLRVYQRHYRTIVENHMPKAHKVVLMDRLPVSRDEEIKVTLESPKNAEVDPETGTFRVMRVLEPGQTMEWDTRFKVEAPREWDLPERY